MHQPKGPTSQSAQINNFNLGPVIAPSHVSGITTKQSKLKVCVYARVHTVCSLSNDSREADVLEYHWTRANEPALYALWWIW